MKMGGLKEYIGLSNTYLPLNDRPGIHGQSDDFYSFPLRIASIFLKFIVNYKIL